MTQVKKWALRGLLCGTVFAICFIVAQVASYTTFATIPSTSPGGTFNVLSDAPLFAYNADSAGTRNYLAPLFPATLVPQSGWAFANQGSASVATANGTIYMQNTAAGASNNLRVYYRTAPGTPYTITAMILQALNFDDIHSCGIGFYESGTSKVVYEALAVDTAGSALQDVLFFKYSSFTTRVSAAGFNYAPLPLWMQIHSDGTNVTGAISADGVNWLPTASLAIATSFTVGPDKVAFVMNANGTGGTTSGCTLVSWKVS